MWPQRVATYQDPFGCFAPCTALSGLAQGKPRDPLQNGGYNLFGASRHAVVIACTQ